MSKLVVDQKTVYELFGNKNAYFLIPDYQRPYAWDEVECQTLWNDIFAFAFPDNNCSKFNNNDEYFLGPIVTFDNGTQKEVIDGQQRLTTLLLLLRAFYCGFGMMQDDNSIATKQMIEACIWKTNEFGKPDMNILKIDSEVASDEHKEEFLSILKTGIVTDKMKSNYAVNYRFFQNKIDEFLHTFPTYYPYLPIRIMRNCILLPIEAESQDTALRIFSTLNDRGKPLSDADIFKAQFYKYYKNKGKKDEFIKRWRVLEEQCYNIFHPISGTPVDELFTRYMYYERACMKIKSSTTEALRKFYEKDNYALLRNDKTFENLELLVDFWNDVSIQSKDRFSDRVLKRLYVLNYAPNGMWNYFVSVYFMHNKDAEGMLDDEKFCQFLNKVTAFVWAYAVTNPGVNALRTPVYAEMVNIIEDKEVEFNGYKFEENLVRSKFNNYEFTNGRPITKSMLTWWAYNDKGQTLLNIESLYEIEHIYAKNRHQNEPLSNPKNLESLGNKILLEKKINIRATDYRFADKIKFYKGYQTSKGQQKEGSKIEELLKISDSKTDFLESDITARDEQIKNAFINYLKENNLLQ